MISRSKWETAQAGEADWHRTHGDLRADDDAWAAHTDWLMTSLGCPKEVSSVIDVGAGPRLRSAWFDTQRLGVVEPLADVYRQDLPWCDLDHADDVWAVPGEQRVPEAVDAFELVVCVNVLDHCQNPSALVGNLASYCAPGGSVLLSTDLRRNATRLHPTTLTAGDVAQMAAATGLSVDPMVTREPFGSKGRAAVVWMHRTEAT